MGNSNRKMGDDFNWWRRAVALVGIITAVVVALFLLWRLRSVVAVLFSAVLVAILFSGIGGWLSDRLPLSHQQAVGITLVGLLLLFGLVGYFTAPELSTQTRELVSSLDASLSDLQSEMEERAWMQPIEDQFSSSDTTSSLVSSISNALSRTLDFFTNGVVILIVGIYLALSPALYANGLIKLVPKPRRRRAGELFDEVAYTLRWWLIGRFLSMLVVGILSFIGLLVLGVPLAFILALITGLLAFIPIVGPLLALLPPTLIAFTAGAQQALYVVLLYMGIQAVESYLITPLIQQRTSSLPPALLLMSQLVFTILFGTIGVAIAAPLTLMLMVVVKMLYVQDVLGDEEVDLLKEEPEARFAASQA